MRNLIHPTRDVSIVQTMSTSKLLAPIRFHLIKFQTLQSNNHQFTESTATVKMSYKRHWEGGFILSPRFQNLSWKWYQCSRGTFGSFWPTPVFPWPEHIIYVIFISLYPDQRTLFLKWNSRFWGYYIGSRAIVHVKQRGANLSGLNSIRCCMQLVVMQRWEVWWKVVKQSANKSIRIKTGLS